ncbi:Dbl homology domain-containing protein [Radiomyces spectabilis]|uniref:Dbl homology domain-containing protein n=1 Tax=Radiomyces spectabilis TaxID=64574 RepID=UPI002220B7A2|nr:Dbl homology domain-containing protein [Radiomyces spectabilis]KAI8371731.1 Dbl homology domain-containing protein [Radiomyces spectabilis]
MPPFIPPSFESIEAKAWACNTVDSLLSTPAPITFEPYPISDIPQTSLNDEQPTTTVFTPPERKKEAMRRSFSLLESRLFRSSRNNSFYTNDEKYEVNLRHQESNSEPIIPTNCQSRSSFSRLRRPWTFDAHIPVPFSTRSAQLARFVVAELITTEETYLNHLTNLKNVFIDPLLEAADTRHHPPLVNMRDVQTIFAYVPQLMVLSSMLVQRLHDGIRVTEDAPSLVGRIFCDLEKAFEVYICYAANYRQSQKCLLKAGRNVVYRQFIQDSLRKKENHRMGLADYLIAPIQRITRYCLLLKDLIKNSNPSHSDYPCIEKALKSLTALALAMNNIQ